MSSTDSQVDGNPFRLDLPSLETCGVLNLHKPSDWTSRDVVNYVTRRARKLKVGHAGTLDPLATGVLVVAVGSMTRLVSYLQQHPKTYRAEFLFGKSSNTDDVEGEVTVLDNPPIPTRQQIEDLLPRFTGEIEQVPPLYSAVHVNGQRAYHLARKGAEFEIPSRTVIIHHLQILGYEYPLLTLEMKCGSGTYVRSLGRDIGKLLGSAAVMQSLERTAIGPYTDETATRVENLTKENWQTFLTPQHLAVSHLPRLLLDAESLWRLARGQPVSFGERAEIASQITSLSNETEAALFDTAGNLYGLARVDLSHLCLHASLMLARLPGAK